MNKLLVENFKCGNKQRKKKINFQENQNLKIHSILIF